MKLNTFVTMRRLGEWSLKSNYGLIRDLEKLVFVEKTCREARENP